MVQDHPWNTVVVAWGFVLTKVHSQEALGYLIMLPFSNNAPQRVRKFPSEQPTSIYSPYTVRLEADPEQEIH